MAEIIAQIPINGDEIKTRRGRNNNRKPLKQKNQSITEANILAQKISQSALSPVPAPSGDESAKENHESLSQPRSSPKKGKGVAKSKQTKQSFEKDLQEMQEKLQMLRIEKEKTEDLLKERDDMLKQKEEELENKGKEQEKLQIELKKLQKLKDFKPTVTLPIGQTLREKEQGKKEKKRPSPPYALWCKDQWNQVKKENPEAAFKDISNILGAKWKNISAEEKKPYEEKYQTEKEGYLRVITKEKREIEAMKLLEDEQKQKTAMELLDQYLQFKQEADKQQIKKSKKERDPLKPKHPMSAFFVFSSERRTALLAENKNVLEVAKIAGEKWKNMNEEQRKPYEATAKSNREKYMKEMGIYKQNKDEEELNLKKEEEQSTKILKQEALQMLKKKEKKEKLIKKTKENQQKNKQVKDPNKPKKPASSFILFSKEARKNINQEQPGLNNSTMNALISVTWKELSEEERNEWNSKAAEAMQEYKKEIEEYNKSIATTVDHHPLP